MSLDLRNAFNEVSRGFVLAALPADAIGGTLARSLYSTDTPVMIRTPGGRVTLECTRGVVQGCPLAAALFAYAIAVGPVRVAREDVASLVG